MEQLISLVFFLILEILMNIISLVIIPKPIQFGAEYLISLYRYKFEKELNYYYFEEILTSPSKTSVAIIIFSILICIIHVIKIITFIVITNQTHCKYSSEYKKYVQIEIINIPFLFINWCMAISMIPKLSKIINEHKEYHLEIFDEFKSKMIKVVVLFTLSYVFIFCQYLFMPLLEICVESCKRCNREEKSVNYYSSPVRNAYNSNTRNNNNNQNNIRSTTSRNNINTKREEVEVRVTNTNTNTNNRVILLFNVLPREIYDNLRSFIEQGKEKMIKLISFYLEMRFVGLTTEENISKEIAGIIVGVAKNIK